MIWPAPPLPRLHKIIKNISKKIVKNDLLYFFNIFQKYEC